MRGADSLAERPDAPVLLVHARSDIADDWHAEHVEAAAKAYPGFVVLPLHGLTIDARGLQGRDVVIWPWMGAPSQRAALRPAAGLLARTAKRVRLIAPAADEAIGPGQLNGHAPIAWAAARCELVAATPAEDLEAEWFGGEAEPGPEPDDGHVLADVPIEVTHERVSDWIAPDHHPDILEDPPPEPVDLFEQPALPRLERAMLPPSLAAFIFDQSEIIGSDPCILAVSALVACAAVTSDAIKLQPKQHEHGWKESARLWGAFVGDPSVKKTPPLNRAIAHLRKIDAEFAEKGAEAMQHYKIQQKVYAKAEAKWIDDQAKHKPCGPLMEQPQRPAVRRVIVQDATIEAVSEVMADNPEGILVVQDELSGFFGSMDAYRAQGGKDRSFWLEAYNGGPRSVDRIGREARHVPNLSACMIGGIQPAAIREKARSMVDDGLLQRFIVVVASSADSIGEDRRADTEATHLYRGILDHLVTCSGDPERPIQLEPGAREVMRGVEIRLNELVKAERLPLRMRYQLGKWSGLFCRLCLTYYAIECAALGLHVAGEIPADIAERVDAFMFGFLLWHLQHFYEAVIGDSTGEVELLHRVARWLLAAKPETFTHAQVAKGVSAWRSAAWNVRRNVLDRLEVCGWVTAERRPTLRGTKAWRLNPIAAERFAGIAEAERLRREEGRARILGEVRDRPTKHENE